MDLADQLEKVLPPCHFSEETVSMAPCELV